MRIQSLNHSAYQHCYHIVWGTKYRRKILKDYVEKEFLDCMYETVKKYPTLYIHALKTDRDHIHMQIEIPPDVTVSKVVQLLKIASSKRLQSKFKFIREIYIEGSVWSVGYFSSTNGLNDDLVKRYIEQQGENDYPKQAGFGFS